MRRVCTLGVGVSGPSSLDVGSSPLVSDCTGREVSLSFNRVNRAYYRGHVASTACLLPTLSHRKREISARAHSDEKLVAFRPERQTYPNRVTISGLGSGVVGR